MIRHIPDQTEPAREYPGTLDIGTFEQTSCFDAHLDETGISLSLQRATDGRKSIRMQFRYGLFAEILRDLAQTVASVPPAESAHREILRDGAQALYLALEVAAPATKNEADASRMTPDEEVLLLHVLE
jgi:hypothetical protein